MKCCVIYGTLYKHILQIHNPILLMFKTLHKHSYCVKSLCENFTFDLINYFFVKLLSCKIRTCKLDCSAASKRVWMTIVYWPKKLELGSHNVIIKLYFEYILRYINFQINSLSVAPDVRYLNLKFAPHRSK